MECITFNIESLEEKNMKLFKKVIAVLAIATMSLSMVACGGSKTPTEMTSQDEKGLIVARVNGEPIYKSDMDNQLAVYGITDDTMKLYYGEDYTSNSETVDQFNSLKKDLLESLVNSQILVLKAKEMKEIKVTDEEINEQLEETKASFTTEDEFNTALEQSGMTLDELKENLTKNLYVTKLVQYYADNKVEVKDEEVETYYNDNIATYTTKPGAEISHILVDSEDKAKEVLEKYNSGTSFSDLAAEYGTDGTKDNGGKLGYIEYDTTQYDADFMTGAKTLGEGEVSEPVKTQFGWHIIKAEGVQSEEKVEPLETVKENILSQLKENKAQEKLTTEIEDWKKSYDIVYYEENYVTQVTEPKESPSPSPAIDAESGTSDETAATDSTNSESDDTDAKTDEASDTSSESDTAEATN